ncbi:MAG: glycosyltransferase [Ignavibacteriae bacterium]|nr:glycosyltransferase [Ignavibacteriota bacterium]
MTSKDISVIIVNYNVKDFLFQCLKSVEKASDLVRKSGFTTEIIVVDNNSTDGSIDYLLQNFPNVNFISLSDNLGFGKANNIGVEKSSGKYLLILNPDTVIEEDNLLKMFNYMESNPEIGAAGCKVLNSDGSFQLSCRRGLPTPWASFSKLFGLQKLFPKSKFFGKYNLTYRSIDETYYIDILIGAYMFVKREAFESVGGFDEIYFMYGEDIDLCYSIQRKGWKISYFHETSIIHYKGESTRRSSIKELYHFYNAMEIFSKKYYNSSRFYLFIIKLGINIRTLAAYFMKFKRQILIILFDLIFLNLSILIGTYFKFGGIFNLPDYAYPTVFIIINILLFGSMVAVGEYFEGKNTIRRLFYGLLLSFFILSSLTYYFREYAFSRGILLFTIGFTALLSGFMRFLISLYDRISGKESDRRMAILGINENTEKIIYKLKSGEARNINLIGMISNDNSSMELETGIPVIGQMQNIPKIIEDNGLSEIIIADSNINKSELLDLISKISDLNVKFHIVTEYEDLLASRIINDVSKAESIIHKYNIIKLRYRILKRIFDIIVSFFLLTIGLPLVYLLSKQKSKVINRILSVFKGEYSLVGLSDLQNERPKIGKKGLTGLVQISKADRLNQKIVNELNEYYLINYSFSLDIDILIKQFFRK